jgi:hypothetical protein
MRIRLRLSYTGTRKHPVLYKRRGKKMQNEPILSEGALKGRIGYYVAL